MEDKQVVYRKFTEPTPHLTPLRFGTKQNGGLPAQSLVADTGIKHSHDDQPDGPKHSAYRDRGYLFVELMYRKEWLRTKKERAKSDIALKERQNEAVGGSTANGNSAGDGHSYDEALETLVSSIRANSVTDVYLMCHGWHRNLYSARAAFDRLFYRFLRLAQRGRIDFAGKVPIFIGAHYHSDPGDNEMVDYQGKASCESFINLCFQRLDGLASEADEEKRADFEEIYKTFAKWTSWGMDKAYWESPNGASPLDVDDDAVVAILKKYRGKELPPGTEYSTLAAWTCFHEADRIRQTGEQEVLPNRFGSPFDFVKSLVSAAIALVGIGMIAGPAWRVIEPRAGMISRWFDQLLPIPGIVGTILFLFVTAWLLVGVARLQFCCLSGREPTKDDLSRNSRRFRFKHGVNLGKTALFLALLAFHATPLILFLLVSAFWTSMLFNVIGRTALIGMCICLGVVYSWWLVAALCAASILYWLSALSDYRERRSTLTLMQTLTLWLAWPLLIRFVLLGWARLPYRAFAKLVHAEDLPASIFQMVENQFSFYYMSKKATDMGVQLGEFISNTYENASCEQSKPKFHLFGHSHGSLVALNAAEKVSSRQSSSTIQTVTTINGAFMSAWFDRHRGSWASNVKGCVATLFSKYDVANSFFYPLAQFGRSSAGSVGHWFEDTKNAAEPLPSISAIDTPNYVDRICKASGTLGYGPAIADVKYINVDASRIVSEGKFPNGSHADINKDDVVQLLYGTTLFEDHRNAFVTALRLRTWRLFRS